MLVIGIFRRTPLSKKFFTSKTFVPILCRWNLLRRCFQTISFNGLGKVCYVNNNIVKLLYNIITVSGDEETHLFST